MGSGQTAADVRPPLPRVVAFVGGPEDAPARWALERLLDGLFEQVDWAPSPTAAGRSEDAPVVVYAPRAPRSRHAPTLHIRPDERLWRAYLRPDSLPGHPLPRVPADALLSGAPGGATLVLPFAGDGSAAALTGSPGRALFTTPADLVASTFYWLAHYAEALAEERDPFGRLPEEALPTVREGTETRPHVDEYREVVRGWWGRLGISLPPPRRGLRVQLTHDVDSCLGPDRRPPRVRLPALRAMVGETLRHRSPRTGVQRALDELAAAHGWTPPFASITDIARRDRRLGFPSRFYLMANGRHRNDADYDVRSPRVRETLAALLREGAEVGLHMGLDAFADPDQLRREWDTLADVLGRPPRGARGHYLGVHVSRTFRLLDHLGCVHDSTMGFSGRCGFRGGTTRPYPLFDVQRRAPLDLLEFPLAIMDKALLDQPRGTRKRVVREVVDQVRRHDGVLVVDWHNVHHGARHLRVWRDLEECLTGRAPARPG